MSEATQEYLFDSSRHTEIERIIHVSVQSTRIIDNLPAEITDE